MKFISLIKAHSNYSSDDVRDWFLNSHAPTLVRSKSLRRLQARFPIKDVPYQAIPAAFQGMSPPASPVYDLIVETWFDSVADFEGQYMAPHFESKLVNEWNAVVKHEEAFQATPYYAWPPIPADEHEQHAITYMALLYWKDIPTAEILRHWREHEEVARRVHVGASRYERNWIDSSLRSHSLSIGGITDMSFNTVTDYQERYWSSPEGAQAVIDDVADFFARGQRVYLTGRHILKA